MYSEGSEINAAIAMLDPSYEFSEDNDPFMLSSTSTDHMGIFNQYLFDNICRPGEVAGMLASEIFAIPSCNIRWLSIS